MGEVTVMLFISSLTISAGNQNNSMPFTIQEDKNEIENKTNLSVCFQWCAGNEVILSKDADNLLKSLQRWDRSDFF